MGKHDLSLPKKYQLGILDPPWDYRDKQNNDPARGGITYPQLTTEQLSDIPLHSAFHKNSIIIVWATMPKLADGTVLSVINAWNFKPITTLFVWVKLNPKGYIRPYGTLDFDKSEPYWEEDKTDANEYQHIRINDLYSGLGQYTNSNVEIAIIARRGKALPRLSKKVKQLIFAPIREHSAKPQVQYKRLSALYGDDIDRLEIFARKQNPPPDNWGDATGLDYDGVDIREWIKQYDR